MREEKPSSSRMACGRNWVFPPAWSSNHTTLISQVFFLLSLVETRQIEAKLSKVGIITKLGFPKLASYLSKLILSYNLI